MTVQPQAEASGVPLEHEEQPKNQKQRKAEKYLLRWYNALRNLPTWVQKTKKRRIGAYNVLVVILCIIVIVLSIIVLYQDPEQTHDKYGGSILLREVNPYDEMDKLFKNANK
ncbi:Small integral membrane protein 8 [Caenorhabditis elegans]|uniref:Small integral membrane protein 8 n=1 Tax=Caenorhabditis elegans TaxID=6239 RepID=Q9XXC5_CAEEL|nr:Small integral membrane protein 8 [Caenorhabditis elegans]CAA19537.1 Small integral membrane protein 8 [Caenorhabditis elegans]|eukprot:NP_496004.1 Uncharacterized protein CELE_Y51B9A.7 [Caenorhabditis elegans]